ncbi:MAG: pyridoxamine 5'-phosphate oxidase family protein [Candidatus Omnitrophota bacterium]|nr:pyridoxamine 5'-phosphate oxidase family protein [Candidatus Omnitrophota bacterium]
MIAPDIIEFFHKQRFTVITTIDEKGYPHNACKGIVDIDGGGRVYLLDLYTARTYENLKRDPRISITGIDEHKFLGYTMKGTAKITPKNKVSQKILKMWEDKINSRIAHRLLKNMQGEKGHSLHPEAMLPVPTYLIEVDVHEVIDLTPPHIKKKGA